MWTYTAPLRDMQFVIEEVLEAPAGWREMPAFAELDVDTARQILEEAGKFAAGVLAPINSAGDLQGCTWRDGEVTTPAGYREAYAAFVEGGWAALACDPEDGGQGLPALLNAAFNEMIAAANHGWTMYPGLLHGAYECLRANGSAELKARYLAKIASGKWLATMNLTEPQAGSDLALVRGKAEPAGGGSFRLSGSKIFTSVIHCASRHPRRMNQPQPSGHRGSGFAGPLVAPPGGRRRRRFGGIHFRRRARPDRQHRAPGARAFARCTGRHQGPVTVPGAEDPVRRHAQRDPVRRHREEDGHQGQRHLRDELRGRHRLVDRRSQPRPGGDVRDNELGAAARRHAGPGAPRDGASDADAYARERVQGRGRPIAEHPAVRRTLWSLRASGPVHTADARCVATRKAAS